MTSFRDSAGTEVDAPLDEAASTEAFQSARPSPLAARRRRSIVRRRGTLVRRSFLITDVVGFALAFLLAEWLVGVGHTSVDDRLATTTEVILFFATLPIWLAIANLYGLYSQDEER